MELAIAIFTSFAIGMVATRYSDYSYWRSWAPRSFWLGLLGLAAVHALGGLLGYAVVNAVTGGPEHAIGAVVEGTAGQALLRAQIDRLGATADSDSRSALTVIHGFIVDFLEGRAKSGVERGLHRLSDQRLTELTFDVFWRHIGDDSSIDEPAAAQLYQFLLSAARELRRPSPDDDDARGRLRGFCYSEIDRRRLPQERNQ